MATDSSVHLGHVHLKVRDVERALDFYQGVLDLEVSERPGNYAFLTFGEHHHDVALQGVGDNAPGPGRGVGLYHAAFEVDTPARLREVYQRLRERGVGVSPVDHGISKALYFDDPAGNGLEVYVDTRDEHGPEWEGTNRRFDPEAL
ncbi:VOC family protein [Halobacterium zhouii]|uniref:VOC family protein n=1 Tax=Halobacterium zhouii TaxID=2902624 RepID=UPI001E57D84F|nr:VOC family protein [Halobacterium zhouii]